MVGAKIRELDLELRNNRRTVHTGVSNAVTERKLQDEQVVTEAAGKHATFRSPRRVEEELSERQEQNGPFDSRKSGFQSKSSILRKSPEGESKNKKEKEYSPNRTDNRRINHSEIDFEIKEED